MEALHCGVPILTLQGDKANSRVAGSMLAALDLTELICNTEDEYLQKAIELGKKNKNLKNTRQKINPHSIFFNLSKNVTIMEKGYLEALEMYRNNLQYHDIALDG